MNKNEALETENPYKELAEELNNLQKDKNEGRGVSCVETVAKYLKWGDIEKARAVCFNEHDKILRYPEIKKFLVDNLFKNQEEHPWSVIDKLEKEREERKREL